MNIVLTGGTGYIGSRLLTRLTGNGHRVTALVRSDTAAATVTGRGAEAVVGDLYDSDWVAGQLRAAGAVVHTASPGDATSEQLDRSVARAAVAALAGTGKPYVHTSGIWVWGSGTDIREDRPFAPPALTAWRAAVEKIVLDADLVTTIVAPAIVYGYGAGIPAGALTARDQDGRVRLVGSGEQHWTTVHVDDVADLYALVVERGEGLGHLIAASGDNPTVREIAEATGDGVAAESVDASRERLGAPFADALLLDQQTRADKARSLGWKPSAPTLVAEFASGSYRG